MNKRNVSMWEKFIFVFPLRHFVCAELDRWDFVPVADSMEMERKSVFTSYSDLRFCDRFYRIVKSPSAPNFVHISIFRQSNYHSIQTLFWPFQFVGEFIFRINYPDTHHTVHLFGFISLRLQTMNILIKLQTSRGRKKPKM